MIEKIIFHEEIKKVAKLARIEVSLREEKTFAEELNSILEYFKDIKEVEINNQDRLDHFDLARNQFRTDQINEPQDEQKKATRDLFPQRKDNYLKVKKVLNNSH